MRQYEHCFSREVGISVERQSVIYVSLVSASSDCTVPSVNSTSVSTWMGVHQRRPGTVSLGPFVVVDLNL